MTATPAARMKSATDAKNRFRRGTAFKEMEKGPLYLEFAFNRIVALRPTPARAWVTARDADSRWFSTIEPELDVSALAREVRDVDAKIALGEEEDENAVIRWRARNFRKFLAHVDADVRTLCAAGWVGRTWSFFRLLQSIPAAREIAMQPGGAHAVFALSRAHTILGGPASEQLPRAPRNPMNFARSWSKHPKKEILGRLGFPAQPAAVNALAKVPRGDVDDACLELLRNALHDPISFKRCCHAQRLPRALVAVLAAPAVRSCCSAQLLETLEYVDMETKSGGYRAPAVLKKPLARCCERAGIDKHLTSHCLRVTTNNLVRQAAGDAAARAMVGHATPAMTARYSDVDKAERLAVGRKAFGRWLESDSGVTGGPGHTK